MRVRCARFFQISLILPLLYLSACPSTTASHIEAAQFALDLCDPSDATTVAFCQEAVDEANAVLAIDADNVEAAMLASAGYLGLAGIDFLQFIAELVEAQNDSSEDLSTFQTLVTDVETTNNITIDIDDLRLAVTVLTTALNGLAADSDLNERAFFQAGIIQALETFIRPIKLITVDVDGNIDPDEIDDANAQILEDNFINGDDNLALSGTTDEETLRAIREGYCRCTLSLFGYSAACVRDLMRCNLSTAPTQQDTEQDYDNDSTVVSDGDDDCDALNNPAGVSSCRDTDTD